MLARPYQASLASFIVSSRFAPPYRGCPSQVDVVASLGHVHEIEINSIAVANAGSSRGFTRLKSKVNKLSQAKLFVPATRRQPHSKCDSDGITSKSATEKD